MWNRSQIIKVLSGGRIFGALPGEENVTYDDQSRRMAISEFARLWYEVSGLSWAVKVYEWRNPFDDDDDELSMSGWVARMNWIHSIFTGERIHWLPGLDLFLRRLMLGDWKKLQRMVDLWSVVHNNRVVHVREGSIFTMVQVEESMEYSEANAPDSGDITRTLETDQEGAVVAAPTDQDAYGWSVSRPDRPGLHLANIPVSGRVTSRQLAALNLPTARNLERSGDLVDGLHRPSYCRLCDRIRVGLPSPGCLTLEDMSAIVAMHLY